MYNRIIENYIKKLNIEKVIEYGCKNDIYLCKDEAKIIIEIIKKDWKFLI